MSLIKNLQNLKTKIPDPVPNSIENSAAKSRFKSHFRKEIFPKPQPDPIRSVPNLKVTIVRSDGDDHRETSSRQVDGPDCAAEPTVRLTKAPQKAEVKRLASIRRKLEQPVKTAKQVPASPRKSVPIAEDYDEPMLWEALREQDKVAKEFEVTSLAEAEVVNRRLEEISERLRRKQLEVELKEERKRAILAHKATFQTLLNVYMDTLAGYDGEFVASFTNQEKSVLELIESFNQLLAVNDDRESTLADVDRTADLCKKLERINTEVIDLRNKMLKERGLIDEILQQPKIPTSCTDEILQFYSEIKRFQAETQLLIKPLTEDPTLFVYRKNLRTVVNIAVSKLSGSCSWMEAQYNALDSLLGGQRVQVGSGVPGHGTVAPMVVTTSGDPAARAYCATMLAEKFVNQADLLISNNPPTAFPIAAVIVALWQKYPDFGSLFLAQLFQECPFLVPYFPSRSEEQSEEDHLKSLGYRFTPDGIQERQIIYLKRMSALARLYGAIVASGLRKESVLVGGHHPYGLEWGWRWICTVLNSDPLADICATLITEFLQMAGHRMWHCYSDQFVKMLRVLYEQYVPALPKGEGWPRARLERLLVKIKIERRIDVPIGTVPEGFW